MVKSKSRQALGADGLKNGLTGELVPFFSFLIYFRRRTHAKKMITTCVWSKADMVPA
jgi:hypothetical protein